MPFVWRRIREELGREPSKSVHPDEAVALGAALLADADRRVDSVVLLDTLAMSIGVGLPGGQMIPVLARNTRLPAKKTYEVVTTADDQAELELAVFQGDAPQVSECEYLGTARISGLPHGPKGSLRIGVEFSLGNEGILSLRARDLDTGKSIPVELATIDTPHSLREKLQLPEAPIAPRGARPISSRLDGTARTSTAASDRRNVSLDEATGAAQGSDAVTEAPAVADAGDAQGSRKGLLSRIFGRR
jgi:molecular chaperone DnaK